MKALQHLAAVRRQFGWRPLLAQTVDLFASKILRLDLNRVFLLDLDQLAEPCVPAGLEARFLTSNEVREFAHDPVNELTGAMADRIDGGRDSCFAVMEHGALVSYGWYALESIEAEHNKDVAMAFPADFIYMYKAFTLPAQRGRRFDSLGRALALHAFAQRGIRRMLATVHWTNWPSLRSFRRMGCTDLGFLYTFGPRRWSLIGTPRRAAPLGVKFSNVRGDTAFGSDRTTTFPKHLNGCSSSAGQSPASCTC